MKDTSIFFRRLVDIVLVFIFTTMFLSMYITRLQKQEQFRISVQQKRSEILTRIRLDKLRRLQKIIFLNSSRPADSTYNINVTLSERTPLERSLPDTRPKKCPRKYDLSSLPTVSVIIPFYNEALSMLLRTVHSVLSRTAESLLKDVIIVDDFSPNKDLHAKLEKYLKYLPKTVQLIRMNRREGLIRARLTGAKMARGDVLMFQDAHTEANEGWAEPLLEEIAKNPKTIIQPHVDQIEQFTLQYIGNRGPVPRGGFTWDLRYVWMEMPDHEAKRLKHQHEFVAHRTPTLVGCAIAIRRDYFWAIGGFDDDMNIWGGENIELGFRGWLCGGQVLNHPCSRVAHTFKPFAYSFDGHREKIVQKNQMRLAELWMDDWKKYFLASTYSWPSKHVTFNDKERISLEKRKIMKKNLKCKGFSWYMSEIISEVPTPPTEAIYYGEVFNLKTELCFYVTTLGYVGLTSFCFFHRLLPQNIFYIDTSQRLVYRHRCVVVDRDNYLLKLGACQIEDGKLKERWNVMSTREVEGLIYVDILVDSNDSSTASRYCATQITNAGRIHNQEQMPQMLPCNEADEFQRWRFAYKFDFNYDWEHFKTGVEKSE